jgi:hypothetical protein
MKLLVSGCSITHGAELHNGFMSDENVKQSFSAHLAQQLDLQLVNVALSGGSNEYIFHSVVDAVTKHSDIAQVLVVWTSHLRLYWKAQGRHYFILPSWASSLIDLENFVMHDKQKNNVWFTGDSDSIVDTLATSHKFFVEHYFDQTELLAKKTHYDLCLKQLCLNKNLSYRSLCIDDIFKFLNIRARHLTAEEHKITAKFLYEQYYS